jgi:hypothetical protein
MDLEDWLRSLGLERYAEALRENEIDGGRRKGTGNKTKLERAQIAEQVLARGDMRGRIQDHRIRAKRRPGRCTAAVHDTQGIQARIASGRGAPLPAALVRREVAAGAIIQAVDTDLNAVTRPRQHRLVAISPLPPSCPSEAVDG